ncbi:MAG: VWA domain-containing protein [Alphaproteobacteria bacterium]|nr:VWA domain-containing protein [Alphaproteobacteria bacterium]
MSRFRTLFSYIGRLASNQNGTTAILFALSVVPLLLAGGAAIDYLRYSQAQTRIQAALDSGALAIAAAADLNSAERIAAGESTFARNIEASGIDLDDVEHDFKLSGKAVTAAAAYKLPAGLMQIAGFSHMDVTASTEIKVPDDKKAEVALVLDYSGSMGEVSGGQVKYVAMKDAAKRLISDLEVSNPHKVKFGLVPFSHHVYVTLPKAFVKDQTGTGNWTGCTQDRRYPYNLTDSTPTSVNATKWGQPQASIHVADGCAPYIANHLKVAPLTEDFDALRSQLDIMTPNAWTHIALGAEFGFHLLSPDAPFTEGAPYSSASTNKFLVILTDGRQTEPAFGPGVRNVAQGETNLEAICDNAKSAGITVLTVAFDLQDEATKARLQYCASDPDTDFLIAEDSSDIAAAFAEIMKQITAQVFISR